MKPKIIDFEEIDSTNNELRRMIERGEATDMMLICTGYQTAGRGQVGNSWESERGKNLLMSMYLKPHDLDVHNQFYFSKAVSNAFTETIESITKEVSIKWPNDIYIGDKKLAGILIENNLRRTKIYESIVGIGLNVNQTTFLSDAPNPISLKQITGEELNPIDIATDFANNMVKWKQLVDNGDFEPIDEKYNSQLYRSVGMHQYHDANGTFEAAIEGISPEGFLLLRDSNKKLRSYAFKEVTFDL